MLKFFIVIHVFLLVYWLGADLGVYYSAKFVVKSELSAQTRATVGKILEAVDLSPRVCLILFLPSGISLMTADPHGASFLTWPLAGLAWIFGFIWLYFVVKQYKTHGANKLLTKIDLWLRYTLIVGLIGTGLYTIFTSEPFGVTTNPKWLGAKVAFYGLAIAGGVGIRKALVPFGPAFGAIASGNSTPEHEAALSSSMAKSLPWVHLIWGCVAICAILGIVKPGMKAF